MTATVTREVFIEGISLWAPRLPGWEVAGAVLAGKAAPPPAALRRPAPAMLPPAERRRAPDSVALAIEVAARACDAAGLDPAALPSVFATTHADLAITDYLCEMLVKTPLLTSPTKFHNSVHNAAAGYWCIATGCHAPYMTVSVFGHSFAAGLLEAFVQISGNGIPVLYVAYDIEACGPLAPVAVSRGLLGAGLVIAPSRTAKSITRMSWSIRPGAKDAPTQAEPGNAGLVEGNAMASCLPLFEALARRRGAVTLALGPELLLDVLVQDPRDGGMNDPRHQDIVILGGGLAGLTLSLQLRQRLPQTSITVLEKRRHPVPLAAHKVGESSVEIAANYFDTVLGLEEHMTRNQLKKFGFRFFFSEGRDDIDGVTELGASRYLPTTSYQIDRGIFENYLAVRAAEHGVRFVDGCTVREITTGGGNEPHQVAFSRDGSRQESLTARWLVDASGRAGLLKRKFGLAEANAHDCNAAWFRIAARLNVDDWSESDAWRKQCDPRARWLSTNHMVGEGYWVWLIPLSSGSHSVGIVAAEKFHPFETINSFERSMAWLRKFQPRVAREVEEKRGLLQDFIAFRRFSYGCRQVYSGDRWAITGEAGLFLDPFYSPGGDFIAISNTYVTDLIARELDGEPCGPRARIYEQYFKTFYESMLTIYTDQYGIFGNPRVLPVKVLWDYTYYWGVLCQIFYQRKLTDLAALTALRPELTAAMALNAEMQLFMRQWSDHSRRDNPPVMLDQASLGWFWELNRGLRDRLDDDQFPVRVRGTTAQLAALAVEIVGCAHAECPGLDDRAVNALLPKSGAPSGESMLFGTA